MAAWLDNCDFNATSTGTGDFVVASVVTGHQTPASAGAVNATVYRYYARSLDLSQWEVGYGAYTVAGTSQARTAVLYNSSGTTSKISFSTVPLVAIVGLKEDLISIQESNTFTNAQKAQARANIGSVGVVKVQVFTASGTYTPSTGMLHCTMECIGGGGAGGGVVGNASYYLGGAGGGSGAYSRKYAAAATIGSSQAVTIGAGGTGVAGGVGGTGGTTSVGTLCTALGGFGGGIATTGTFSPGGTGGNPGTGDVSVRGSVGVGGFYSNSIAGGLNIQSHAGSGGNSAFGGGGAVLTAAATNSGGGGGGYFSSAAAGNFAGATGGSGIVIITEFCTQ